MMTVAWAVFTVVGAGTIVLYGTWLFVARLRKGEPKTRSFGAWLKHVLEAIWGL